MSSASPEFGLCELTLLPATRDPVITPSGHIYSREALLEYYVTKSTQLKSLRKEARHAKALLAEQEQARQDQARGSAIRAFEEREVIGVASAGKVAVAQSSPSTMARFTREGIGASVLREYKTPESGAAADEIPKYPPSPISGRPLRFKEQVFAIDLEAEVENPYCFVCAVSKKRLKNQNVVAITKTKKVMLQEVYDKLARPTMTCPVTGLGFSDADVIVLSQSGDGGRQRSAKKLKMTD